MKKINYTFTFGGFFYGFKENKNKMGSKYFKSHNVRFDETCGGTFECSEKEYFDNFSKYNYAMH